MNGKAHATASLVLSIPCGVVAYALTENVAVSVGAVVGCIAGIPISSDLDQETLSAVEWQIVKRTFGLGFLWLLFWYPYALCHKHRGISHWPVVGTLGRLAYMLLPVLFLCIAAGVEMPEVPLVVWHAVTGAVVSLMVSDTAHWVMDL